MVMEEEQKIRISSRTENIVLVEKLINEICESRKISEDFYGNILVALTEAVNNAIMHGNKSNPAKNIDIHYTVTESIISFIIEDEGEGFDFDTLPDPTNPENIEKPNGRGVFLMKNLADNVEFTNNGSTVRLDFKVSAN